MRCKLLITAVGSICLVLVQSLPAHAVAEQEAPVLINEILPESAQSGSEELVGLYNPRDAEVDITGWRLQYRSAANTSDSGWISKATLACKIPSEPGCRVIMPAHSLLTLATYDIGHPAHDLTSGMALSGGQLRLLQPAAPGKAQVVHDMVGYGTAVVAEGQAAVGPKKGVSIKRHIDEQGVVQDTDNNQQDFILNQPADPEIPPGEAPADPGKGSGEPSYPPLLITEVLPDPAALAEDENDEFIELYNPHDGPVNIKGYVLQAGSNWRYNFILPDITIPAFGYVAFTSEQTGIALSNSGTGVRLLDPAGRLIDELAAYGKARSGQSWIRLETGEWRWSLQPTPGATNVLAEEPPKPVAAVVPKAKKAAVKKPSSSAKPKVSSVKAAKVPKEPKTSTPKAPQQAAQAKQEPNYWLIGTVAALASGYVLYEYRHDALNTLRRVREARKISK